MQLVLVIWSMLASACITLGLIHALVWWQHREKIDRLWFALLAGSTAWLSYFECRGLLAQNLNGFGESFRWMHLPTWCMIVALIGYIFTRFRAGNWWLAGAALGLRSLGVVINFIVDPNLNFRAITGLEQVVFLGMNVTRPIATPSPWMLIAHAALLFLLLFVADATRTVWRRGERRRALLVGGSVLFFVTLAAVQTMLGLWQIAKVPPGGSLYFVGLIFMTAFELSLETKRVKALSAELQDTRQAHQEQVAHLGRVATFGEVSVTLAHEMNQPLATILSNAQAAQRLLAKDQPDLPEVRAILDDIVSEDRRAAQVIQRMRAILRQGETSHESLNLNAIAHEVVAILRHPLRDRQVTLTTDLAADLPAVSADRIQLQQVLINLVLNACEAMQGLPPGERRLHVSTRADGAAVTLAVSDSGPGLPGDVERIYQPFYTTKPQGLGMGLAICRSIATAHGGSIVAEPAAAGGATFSLHLPKLGNVA